MRLRTIALVATLTPALLGAQSPSGSRIAATTRFELFSDPWVNLHHFLYQWSRADRGLGTGRQRVDVPERTSLDSIPPRDRDVWLNALEFYRDSVAALSHFERRMLDENRRLALLNGDPAATPPNAIPGIAAALTAAMPVYRSHWWSAHDRANRKWAQSVVPLLQKYEGQYVELTKRTHDAHWPDRPFRVDVSAYANPAAGYTESGGHVVIFSTDARNQELYGLETLLHEVQHADAISSTVREEFRVAFKQAGMNEPDNLWHAIIFGTAGAFVQTIAKQEGRPEHVPYWVKEGLPELSGWTGLRPGVDGDWVPVVRGEATRAGAFAALVRRYRK